MGRARILVVDDDPLILGSLGLLLEERFDVLTAESAAEARRVLGKHDVAVIVADEKMPGETGVQLFAWARQHHPRTVRILLTGYTDVQAVIQAINAGKVWYYLSKPWDNAELVGLIEEGIRLYDGTDAPAIRADPEEARWHGREDFGHEVREAIRRWLEATGTPARVSLTSGSDGPREDPGRIALADGSVLALDRGASSAGSWAALVGRVWSYVGRENAVLEATGRTADEGYILASEAIRRAHRRVVEAALSGARCLLLIGPTGAGKEELARTFHRESRRGGPFQPCNCARFQKDMAHAELFGAHPGAYTSCERRRLGFAERAEGGTLFLDEIGEMPLDVQPTLLRFLDRGEYEPMAHGAAPLYADVRVVAATNRDLRAAIARGDFRADLWYRLATSVVEVPPLEERPEDVLAFLGARPMAAGHSLLDALSAGARRVVEAHPWDGNFRELANFAAGVRSSVGPGGVTEAACLDLLQRGGVLPPTAPPPDPSRAASAIPAAASPSAWEAIHAEATLAFAEDFDRPMPADWNDVKEYIERYLKPVFFAHLGGVSDLDGMAAVDVQSVRRRLSADRGTVTKHLQRYFERFAKQTA